jgi:hypothetical protein
MKNYIDIIKKLIKEIKRIEIIYYKVACDTFTLYDTVLFNDVSNGKLRMKNLRADWIYFNKIKKVLDDNVSNYKKALKLVKKIKEPAGALEYYGDINYIKILQSIADRVIELNATLDKEKQLKEVLDLERDMKKLQAKKYITTEQFAQIYNISISRQRDYRGRLNNPLPYHQTVAKGKITYDVGEVEEWRPNQHK